MEQRFELPARVGERPRTTTITPHAQLDQAAPAEQLSELVEWIFARFPDLHRGGSRFCGEFVGFHLDPQAELSPAWKALQSSAVDWRRELGHIHTRPDAGSLHLWLAPADARELIDKGWGEYHVLVASGVYQPAVVMVYAPRDRGELDVVKTIIARSYALATGQESASHTNP